MITSNYYTKKMASFFLFCILFLVCLSDVAYAAENGLRTSSSNAEVFQEELKLVERQEHHELELHDDEGNEARPRNKRRKASSSLNSADWGSNDDFSDDSGPDFGACAYVSVKVKGGRSNGSEGHSITFQITGDDNVDYSASFPLKKGKLYYKKLQDNSGGCYTGAANEFLKIEVPDSSGASVVLEKIRVTYPGDNSGSDVCLESEAENACVIMEGTVWASVNECGSSSGVPTCRLKRNKQLCNRFYPYESSSEAEKIELASCSCSTCQYWT